MSLLNFGDKNSTDIDADFNFPSISKQKSGRISSPIDELYEEEVESFRVPKSDLVSFSSRPFSQDGSELGLNKASSSRSLLASIGKTLKKTPSVGTASDDGLNKFSNSPTLHSRDPEEPPSHDRDRDGVNDADSFDPYRKQSQESDADSDNSGHSDGIALEFKFIAGLKHSENSSTQLGTSGSASGMHISDIHSRDIRGTSGRYDSLEFQSGPDYRRAGSLTHFNSGDHYSLESVPEDTGSASNEASLQNNRSSDAYMNTSGLGNSHINIGSSPPRTTPISKLTSMIRGRISSQRDLNEPHTVPLSPSSVSVSRGQGTPSSTRKPFMSRSQSLHFTSPPSGTDLPSGSSSSTHSGVVSPPGVSVVSPPRFIPGVVHSKSSRDVLAGVSKSKEPPQARTSNASRGSDSPIYPSSPPLQTLTSVNVGWSSTNSSEPLEQSESGVSSANAASHVGSVGVSPSVVGTPSFSHLGSHRNPYLSSSAGVADASSIASNASSSATITSKLNALLGARSPSSSPKLGYAASSSELNPSALTLGSSYTSHSYARSQGQTQGQGPPAPPVKRSFSMSGANFFSAAQRSALDSTPASESPSASSSQHMLLSGTSQPQTLSNTEQLNPSAGSSNNSGGVSGAAAPTDANSSKLSVGSTSMGPVQTPSLGASDAAMPSPLPLSSPASTAMNSPSHGLSVNTSGLNRVLLSRLHLLRHSQQFGQEDRPVSAAGFHPDLAPSSPSLPPLHNHNNNQSQARSSFHSHTHSHTHTPLGSPTAQKPLTTPTQSIKPSLATTNATSPTRHSSRSTITTGRLVPLQSDGLETRTSNSTPHNYIALSTLPEDAGETRSSLPQGAPRATSNARKMQLRVFSETLDYSHVKPRVSSRWAYYEELLRAAAAEGLSVGPTDTTEKTRDGLVLDCVSTPFLDVFNLFAAAVLEVHAQESATGTGAYQSGGSSRYFPLFGPLKNRALPSLSRVSLINCGLSALLVLALPTLPSLTHLDLSDNDLRGLGTKLTVGELCDAAVRRLETNTSEDENPTENEARGFLVDLSISVPTSAAGSTPNLLWLTAFPSLTHLCLRNCNLTAVPSLAAAPALLALDLSCNALNGLSGLEGAPSLQTLDISFNRCSSLSAARPLSLLRALRTLRVYPCPFALSDRDNYRVLLAGLLPQLLELDGTPIGIGKGKMRGQFFTGATELGSSSRTNGAHNTLQLRTLHPSSKRGTSSGAVDSSLAADEAVRIAHSTLSGNPALAKNHAPYRFRDSLKTLEVSGGNSAAAPGAVSGSKGRKLPYGLRTVLPAVGDALPRVFNSKKLNKQPSVEDPSRNVAEEPSEIITPTEQQQEEVGSHSALSENGEFQENGKSNSVAGEHAEAARRTRRRSQALADALRARPRPARMLFSHSALEHVRPESPDATLKNSLRVYPDPARPDAGGSRESVSEAMDTSFGESSASFDAIQVSTALHFGRAPMRIKYKRLLQMKNPPSISGSSVGNESSTMDSAHISGESAKRAFVPPPQFLRTRAHRQRRLERIKKDLQDLTAASDSGVVNLLDPRVSSAPGDLDALHAQTVAEIARSRAGSLPYDLVKERAQPNAGGSGYTHAASYIYPADEDGSVSAPVGFRTNHQFGVGVTPATLFSAHAVAVPGGDTVLHLAVERLSRPNNSVPTEERHPNTVDDIVNNITPIDTPAATPTTLTTTTNDNNNNDNNNDFHNFQSDDLESPFQDSSLLTQTFSAQHPAEINSEPADTASDVPEIEEGKAVSLKEEEILKGDVGRLEVPSEHSPVSLGDTSISEGNSSNFVYRRSAYTPIRSTQSPELNKGGSTSENHSLKSEKGHHYAEVRHSLFSSSPNQEQVSLTPEMVKHSKIIDFSVSSNRDDLHPVPPLNKAVVDRGPQTDHNGASITGTIMPSHSLHRRQDHSQYPISSSSFHGYAPEIPSIRRTTSSLSGNSFVASSTDSNSGDTEEGLLSAQWLRELEARAVILLAGLKQLLPLSRVAVLRDRANDGSLLTLLSSTVRQLVDLGALNDSQWLEKGFHRGNSGSLRATQAEDDYWMFLEAFYLDAIVSNDTSNAVAVVLREWGIRELADHAGELIDGVRDPSDSTAAADIIAVLSSAAAALKLFVFLIRRVSEWVIELDEVILNSSSPLDEQEGVVEDLSSIEFLLEDFRSAVLASPCGYLCPFLDVSEETA